MGRAELIENLSDDVLLAGPDVQAVTLHRVSLPLRRPLESAHGTERSRESTLVRVTRNDGHEGWGECAALARPTYTAEYADGAFRMLRDWLVPALFHATPSEVVGHPMARAALEGALVDALLRATDRSLATTLGATRASVPTVAVIGRTTTVDDLVGQVADAVDRSIRAISIKIAPGWDHEPLLAVRDTWPSLDVAADGNGAYRRQDREQLAALDALHLHHLEQPLPADDLVGLSELRGSIDTPVALDESIMSVSSLDNAVASGALDALNLKPARVGGLLAALQIVDRATEHGLPIYCGGLLETGVGRAHAVAVAALDDLTWPTHLGPSDRYFDEDLTEAFVLDADGSLVLPRGPGIGAVPDPSRLHEVEVEQIVLRAGSS